MTDLQIASTVLIVALIVFCVSFIAGILFCQYKAQDDIPGFLEDDFYNPNSEL